MSESIIVYKANDHLEASSCLSNLIIDDIKSLNKIWEKDLKHFGYSYNE